MSNEFNRGKIIITAIVGTIIILNGIGIWFNHNRLLKWYAELAQTLTDSAARTALHDLQVWFQVNQGGIFSNDILNYGVIIFLALMLYLGYDWSRWFWGIYWLAGGIIGTLASTTTWFAMAQFDRLLLVSYTISLTYIVCGLIIVTSPDVRAYIRAMRDPRRGLKYL